VLAPANMLAEEKAVRLESSTEISERSFNQTELNKKKLEPDFQYDLNRKLEEPSLLDKILYRIVGFLLSVIFNPTGSAENIVFYIICVALIIGLILIVMRMNAIGIFAKRNARDGNGLDFSELTEDINTIDFDKMIEEAVQTGMYRRAVRLYYLKSLKQLSDKSQIVWEINKTNRDYLYELKSAPLRTGFENITYVYEYVWYGNVEIDAEKFSRVRADFNAFSTLTTNAR